MARRLRDKAEEPAGARKSARRKRFEPLITLRSLLISLRMTPLELLLERRLWLSIICAFDTPPEARERRDYHGHDEHLLGAPFEGAPCLPQCILNRTHAGPAPPPYPLTHAHESCFQAPPRRGRAGENEIFESGGEAGRGGLLLLELRTRLSQLFAPRPRWNEHGRAARRRWRRGRRGSGREERAGRPGVACGAP